MLLVGLYAILYPINVGSTVALPKRLLIILCFNVAIIYLIFVKNLGA